MKKKKVKVSGELEICTHLSSLPPRCFLSLKSSTRMISWRCCGGVLSSTLQMVRSSGVHASFVKMMTTLTDGRSASYRTALHCGSRVSGTVLVE